MLVSPERLDILLRIILTVLASVLLLAPVIILFEFQPTDPTQFRSRSRWQVVTIFVSTLLFSASCSIFTKARRQEVFTATAAYCAVLVVFLGNASNVTMVQSTSWLKDHDKLAYHSLYCLTFIYESFDTTAKSLLPFFKMTLNRKLWPAGYRTDRDTDIPKFSKKAKKEAEGRNNWNNRLVLIYVNDNTTPSHQQTIAPDHLGLDHPSPPSP